MCPERDAILCAGKHVVASSLDVIACLFSVIRSLALLDNCMSAWLTSRSGPRQYGQRAVTCTHSETRHSAHESGVTCCPTPCTKCVDSQSDGRCPHLVLRTSLPQQHCLRRTICPRLPSAVQHRPHPGLRLRSVHKKPASSLLEPGTFIVKAEPPALLRSTLSSYRGAPLAAQL